MRKIIFSCIGAVAADTGLKGVSINHISFDVHDYTKVRDFYVDLFGVKVWGENVKHDRPPQCHLRFGDTYVTLRNRTANTPRVDHIAVGIKKFDKKVVEAELKRRGIPVVQWDSNDSPNIKDPEGFNVQIIGKEYETA